MEKTIDTIISDFLTTTAFNNARHSAPDCASGDSAAWFLTEEQFKVFPIHEVIALAAKHQYSVYSTFMNNAFIVEVDPWDSRKQAD